MVTQLICIQKGYWLIPTVSAVSPVSQIFPWSVFHEMHQYSTHAHTKKQTKKHTFKPKHQQQIHYLQNVFQIHNPKYKPCVGQHCTGENTYTYIQKRSY